MSLIKSLLIVTVLCFATSAWAANYYVATTGSDSNLGTEASPWGTLPKGYSALRPGDTLYIRGGAYAHSASTTTGLRSGTSWTNPITIRSYPGETVTFKPAVYGITLQPGAGKNYVIFDGLIIDGRGGFAGAVRLDSIVRIINSEIKDSPHTGILIDVGATGAQLINVKSHGHGLAGIPRWDGGPPDNNHGLYITASHVLVKDSEFYNNAGIGIQMFSHSYNPSYNIIINNKSHNNAALGLRGAGIGVYSNGTGNIVANNEVWNNKTGIETLYGTRDTVYCNNKAYNNRDWGMIIGPGVPGSKIGPNDFTRNPSGAISDRGSGTVFNFTGCAAVLASLPTISGSGVPGGSGSGSGGGDPTTTPPCI